jgi:hypothetical protein
MIEEHTSSGLPRNMVFAIAGLVGLSCVAFLFGADGDTQRIWANLLVVTYGLLGLGLGAVVLLALLFVTGARWSDGIRPALERLAQLLPVGGVGVAVVLVAAPSLYTWQGQVGENSSGFQAFWLSRRFFLLRAFIYLALWLGLGHFLVRASQQKAGPADGRNRLAAAFLVVFAITCWLASVDWIMSLEPKWSSTIFGVYHFAGMFLGALAALIVMIVCSDRRGEFSGPLRDLGTLLFSFSSFWAYAWFCQYMLIWYVNNPEETEYFVRRQHGPWEQIFIANVVLNWGVPFAVLLFRRAKETPAILVVVAAFVLVGRWLDLYWMVVPPVAGNPSPWDASLLMAAIGVAALTVAWRFRVQPIPHT